MSMKRSGCFMLALRSDISPFLIKRTKTKCAHVHTIGQYPETCVDAPWGFPRGRGPTHGSDPTFQGTNIEYYHNKLLQLRIVVVSQGGYVY